MGKILISSQRAVMKSDRGRAFLEGIWGCVQLHGAA